MALNKSKSYFLSHSFLMILLIEGLSGCHTLNNGVSNPSDFSPSASPTSISTASPVPTPKASNEPSPISVIPTPILPTGAPSSLTGSASPQPTASTEYQCIYGNTPSNTYIGPCPAFTITPEPTAPPNEPCYFYDKYPDMGPCPSISGKVYDQTGKPVEGVKVELLRTPTTSLSDLTKEDGSYYIQGDRDYSKDSLRITKQGFATRRFYLKDYPSNSGYIKTSLYIDFGGDGSQASHHPTLFLDDRPEVINVGRNDTNNPLTPEFLLEFSEPVETTDIETKFHLVARSSPYLLVYQSAFYFGKVEYINLLFHTWEPGIPIEKNQIVFGPQHFNFNWNTDHSKVTLGFKTGIQVVSNKNPEGNSFYYGLAFVDPENKDRGIRDLAGNVRSEKHFAYGDPYLDSNFYKYIGRMDDSPPRLLSLQALESSLRLNFSEIMAIQTYKYLIAGGMIDMLPPGLPGSETRSPAEYPGNLGNVTGRKTAANYQLKLERAGTTVFQTTWKALGGEARYDSEDPTRQSVRLYPPHSTQAVNGFYPAFSAVSTTAVNAGFGQGSSGEQNWVLRWQGIGNKGEAGVLHEVSLAGNALYSPSEWANQLQLALQASSSGEGNWQVQASADGSQLQLKLASESGEFIGWKLVSISSPSAAFPSTLSIPSQNWAAHTDWKWWQAGDKLSIEVINPIFDPAGNSIDPNAKTASATL